MFQMNGGWGRGMVGPCPPLTVLRVSSLLRCPPGWPGVFSSLNTVILLTANRAHDYSVFLMGRPEPLFQPSLVTETLPERMLALEGERMVPDPEL